jgi:hypothetical protein
MDVPRFAFHAGFQQQQQVTRASGKKAALLFKAPVKKELPGGPPMVNG